MAQIVLTTGNDFRDYSQSAQAINVYADKGNDTVGADAQNDTLEGAEGNDSLLGYAGDDSILGGDGNDTVFGGDNNDIVVGGQGSDKLYGEGGNDTIYARDMGLPFEPFVDSGDYLNGGEGNDVLYAAGHHVDFSSDTLIGGAGDDVFRIDGSSVAISGGDGFDTIESTVTVVLSGRDDIEAVTLTGSAASAIFGGDVATVLTGNGAGNVILTGRGADTVYGMGGDDTIHTSSDADGKVLYGGAGNDVFEVDSASCAIHENAGEGIDTVIASVSFRLPTLDTRINPPVGYADRYVENLTLTGSATDGGGNDLDNVVTGNELNNELYGYAGADTLVGGDGADTLHGSDLFLNGRDAIDRLVGGLGDDTFVIERPVENSNGSFTYDTIVEEANGGTDTELVGYFGQTSFRLDDNIENGVVTGSETLTLIGNALDNSLTGNGSDQALAGLGGDDTLDGGAGYDSLTGGDDDDVYVLGDVTLIDDGFGHQAYVYDAITDTSGIDTVRVGAQQDITAYVLDASIENGVVTGSAAYDLIGNGLNNALTGNAAANALTGGEGADSLQGGGGLDTLTGGAGSDLYVLGDVTLVDDGFGHEAWFYDTISEAVGGGTDTVWVAAATGHSSYALQANFENGAVIGSADFDLDGNGVANSLTGNGGANKLSGLDGADTLEGGGGLDTLAGGAKDDVYVLSDVTLLDDGFGHEAWFYDTVVEAAGGGTDTVRVGAQQDITSYTLGDQIENGVVTGSAAFDLAGNGLANRLTGNAAANRLDGGVGADTMEGGAGNDTYVVDDVKDVVKEAGGGHDLVLSSHSFSLAGQALDDLTLTRTGNTNATGNSYANHLIGNAGSNRLNGAAGADTMEGGAGNDTYVVDNAGDVVREAGGGTDLVESAVSFTLAGQALENLTLTGTISGLHADGNSYANVIIGSAAANQLDGMAGADTMTGGAGHDYFLFSTALGSSNVDRITDFSVADDTIRLSKTVFAGLSTGTLSSAAFHVGAAAGDASDRIVYDSATGKLFFDDDGAGVHAAKQFATITAGLALTNADFQVV